MFRQSQQYFNISQDQLLQSLVLKNQELAKEILRIQTIEEEAAMTPGVSNSQAIRLNQ